MSAVYSKILTGIKDGIEFVFPDNDIKVVLQDDGIELFTKDDGAESKLPPITLTP